ncbi:DNA recombination protein RmuC [uncultured Caulobacter sp.]|uniref:DNA recombination protein RmuC n=1 Tax=uncultured Caulobacter sp. TaxID=158749 RepID=UPI0026114D36|nr:DNA recombination protein RmuC [uncultured Caulobacter sp.]
MLALSITTAIAAVLACAFALVSLLKRSTRAQMDPETTAKLIALEAALKDIQRAAREDNQALRDELRNSLLGHQQALEARLASFGQAQSEQLAAMRTEASDGRAKLEEALKISTDAFANTQTTRLGETNQAMKELAERLQKDQQTAREQQKQGLDAVAQKIQALTEANDKKQDAIREALTTNLDQLRKDNEAKLEQMRVTVDEKLQGTLETRLGESFKLVSDRLDLVHKGLGEMQNLATGVGDLKRVLTNVKSRGGWGEMQLSALLGDMLTPDQFEANVHILPGSNEVVEFAVRLPGKFDDTPVYLPIDAKFPHEDYDRLLTAQDSGIPEEVEKAAMALERTVRAQAKLISEKYIHPPHSTDFAFMYLPTEGLYAEVIRRPGLCADLQSKHRVMVTGPTTLTAVLNSLQMGFRTLAIEKRSSEVWQVLSAAKAEFSKYGGVWDKLSKQLETAQKTVAEAGRRTRAVQRKLRDVETVELPAGVDVLSALPDIDAPDDEEGEAA